MKKKPRYYVVKRGDEMGVKDSVTRRVAPCVCQTVVAAILANPDDNWSWYTSEQSTGFRKVKQ